MTLSTKKRVDYYLGGLFILLLRLPVWGLGRILRRDHTLTPRGEICFIKLLGAGSLVIAFPALLGIRRRYPFLTISLITMRGTASFAEALCIFDRIHVVDDTSLISLVRSVLQCFIRTFRVDTLVDFEVYSRLTTVLSTVTCARNRIGFYLETVFWRRHLHTHLVFYNRSSGVYQFYDAIARYLGAQPAPTEACQEVMSKHWGASQHPVHSGSRIAIGHGCSELGQERMLSVSQWLSVLQARLAKESLGEVLLLGSSADRAAADRIISAGASVFPHLAFRNLCGTLSVQESLGMLAACDEFWGIDSVLLHWARLFGLKCISYWGPTDPKTRLRAVPGLAEEVYYDKVPCSPCIHVAEEPPCGGNNVCIQGLFREIPEKDAITWMV